MSLHHEDLSIFYEILGRLRDRIGVRYLKACHSRMNWPKRGVYFYFEPGEFRSDGRTLRVVRVGTHAVSSGSRSTLWKRLMSHKGTHEGGGNHRGSIFRRWVGSALMNNRPDRFPNSPTWGVGSTAKADVRRKEKHLERAVSAYIGEMPFLWIDADDEPNKHSVRGVIESHAIALLSCCGKSGATADHPSKAWLGYHCESDAVRRSGLWNVRGVDGEYDDDFLSILAKCANATGHGENDVKKVSGYDCTQRLRLIEFAKSPSRETIALVSCVKRKATTPQAAKALYTSPLFRLSRAYAQRYADRWFILSAKHGLLHPEMKVTPYEKSLTTMSTRARLAWAERVYEQMRREGLLHDSMSFLWLAGKKYQKELSRLLGDFEQFDPLAGLRMGERLAWLGAAT